MVGKYYINIQMGILCSKMLKKANTTCNNKNVCEHLDIVLWYGDHSRPLEETFEI